VTEREVLAFDLYGTLVDPIAISGELGRVLGDADGREAAGLWRLKQLEYSFRLTAMGRYEDFRWVTSRALDFALAALGRRLPDDQAEQLAGLYDHLRPFPDAARALRALAGLGYELAVLSNGTPSMITNCLDNSGLVNFFGQRISVDEVRVFKPSPVVYRHAAERLARPIGQVRLVTSTAALVEKYQLTFPVGYGADAEAVAALTGAPSPTPIRCTCSQPASCSTRRVTSSSACTQAPQFAGYLEDYEPVRPRGEAAFAAEAAKLAQERHHRVAGRLMGQVVEFPAGNPGSRFPAAQFADGDADKQAVQPGEGRVAHCARGVEGADPLDRRVIQRHRRIPARIHHYSLSAGLVSEPDEAAVTGGSKPRPFGRLWSFSRTERAVRRR
jgi:2-haloacid dehalogenase